MASRLIYLFLALWALGHITKAQNQSCGTQEPTFQQRRLIRESLSDVQMQSMRTQATASNEFAIVAHVVRRSNGTGGLSVAQLNDALANVNDYYANANMSFFYLDIRYIDDSEYFDYFTGDESKLTAGNNYDGAINVYFVNSANNGEFSLCGYAYFPGDPDVILMVNSCTLNGSTFPHEIGHFFSLYHTHGSTNTGTTDELVVRPGEVSASCVENCLPANCEVAGDELCDTFADPNLSGQVQVVSDECTYVSNGSRPEVDENGDIFSPDVTNIMSYSTKDCRNVFSPGQYNRMDIIANTSRAYLHRNPEVMAYFEADAREVCLGEVISFADRSINVSGEALTYNWSFPGGIPSSSTDPNPTVFYDGAGIFNVSLEITAASGSSDIQTYESLISVRDEVNSDLTSTSGSFEFGLQENTSDSDGIRWISSTEINAGELNWLRDNLGETPQASNGNEFVYLKLFAGANGSEDFLFLDPINTSSVKGFQLSFDYAYAAISDGNQDKLEVVYRDPCGEWVSAWSVEGTEMQTVANNDSIYFIPFDAAHWRSASAIFAVSADIQVTEIAFRVTTDNGNSIHLDNYQLEPYNTFSVSEIIVDNPSCADMTDGSLIVLADSDDVLEYSLGGESFSMDNEFTELGVGDYQVIVRDQGGYQIAQTITISPENEYPPKPVITLSDGNLTIAETDAEEIIWYFEGEVMDDTGALILENPTLGIYSVTLANGVCTISSDPFAVLSSAWLSNQLAVYPNPAGSSISFKAGALQIASGSVIEVNDLTGKTVLKTSYQGAKTLDISKLKSGIYFLNLIIEGQKVSKRFMKK